MHDSRMAQTATGKAVKVQRGISLPPSLYAAIQSEAIKSGRSWNDVAEAALARAFAESEAMPA